MKEIFAARAKSYQDVLAVTESALKKSANALQSLQKQNGGEKSQMAADFAVDTSATSQASRYEALVAQKGITFNGSVLNVTEVPTRLCFNANRQNQRTLNAGHVHDLMVRNFDFYLQKKTYSATLYTLSIICFYVL